MDPQKILEGGAKGNVADILTNYEAEFMVEMIKVVQIEEYGSKEFFFFKYRWSKQDEIIQKLNMQAHINALMRSDEYIMESLITFDKIKILIYQLLVSEVWKAKVLPLIKNKLVDISSFRAYTTIYHESCICNLLQVILYYRSAVESADSELLELIDYSYRKCLKLLENCKIKKPELSYKEKINRTPQEDYQEQIENIEFQIQMMCLSIIRFCTDQVKILNVSVIHHMLLETDILCILVPLIEEKPWMRTNSKGEREIYENQKWVVVEKNDYSKIPKQEVFQIKLRHKYGYQYTTYLWNPQKSNLLRLKKYMNELLLDQIPILSPMLRSLEELSIVQVQTIDKMSPFVVQQMPEMRNNILEGKDWKSIAKNQLNNFFKKEDKQQLKEDMQKMSELYGQDWLEGLMDGFTCPLCQKEATKRCSKCKNVWYCSRDCQVKDWPQHKITCATFEKQISKQQPQQEKINQNNLVQVEPSQKPYIEELD